MKGMPQKGCFADDDDDDDDEYKHFYLGYSSKINALD
jgi:hypothetical protein